MYIRYQTLVVFFHHGPTAASVKTCPTSPVQDTCTRIAAQLGQFLVETNVISHIHNLKRRCESEGPRVWSQAVSTIPFPARALVEAIAVTKPFL